MVYPGFFNGILFRNALFHNSIKIIQFFNYIPFNHDHVLHFFLLCRINDKALLLFQLQITEIIRWLKNIIRPDYPSPYIDIGQNSNQQKYKYAK